MLRDRISDLITNELFERFGSPSAAVIGVKLADEILALPEIKTALAYAPKGTVKNIVTKDGGRVTVPFDER